MKILSFNLSHHASAAVVEDGVVTFAMENARLSQIKNDNYIIHVLNLFNNKFFDIVCYTSFNLSKKNKDYYKQYLIDNLKIKNITYNELIEFPFHHQTHCFSAFYNSGFDEAICLIIDNGGVFLETENISLGREILSIVKTNGEEYLDILKICSNNENQIYEKLNLLSLPVISPAGLFEMAKDILNYKEPGSIMGRASYGKNSNKFCKIYKFEGNKFFINPIFLYQLAHENKDDENDICFKIQKESTEFVLRYLELIKLNFPHKKICLSGGFFQNCMVNYEIIKNNYDVFVDPVSHDGGTAVGLAQYIYKIKTNKKVFKYKNLYLGLKYNLSKDYFESLLIKNQKLFTKIVTTKEVAELLFQNKSIALYQGKSEFGPRALGNRSILFNPCNPFAKEKINLIKKREWFRPYAGTVLFEDKEEWFEFYKKESTEFMSYAVEIKKSKIKIIPGVCHIDNTCRVQTLKKQDNINFYNLIEEFKKLTNVPILLNTSLNVAGKPLVENPEDLIKFILETNIDYAYLPEINLLISKSDYL